jgi:FkbM family methyltransferase
MASVNSPFRRFVKPVIMKCLGPGAYRWFFLRGKIRDIDRRLVEEAEMSLLPRLIGAGDTVLDVGANFAYYTVRMAELCPQGKVVAFEPIPSTFDVCRRIVSHYGLRNVELHQKGVGARAETKRFEVPLQELGTHSAGQAHMAGRDNGLPGKEKYHPFERHEAFDCSIVELDGFLGEAGRIGFIKIDIEGAEYFALQGMRKILQRDRPHVLIEICPYFLRGFGIGEAQLSEWIGAQGYLVYAFEPENGRLVAASSPFADGNYLLIHRDRASEFSDLIEARRPEGGKGKHERAHPAVQ